MGDWSRELVQAARGLARTPVVTAAALATLALGIGANSAVFSVVRGVLLRPLPFPEPDALVVLSEIRPQGPRRVAPANYLDWRARTAAFESLAAMGTRPMSLLGADAPVRVSTAHVSGNFFVTLGVEAAVGRTFDPAYMDDDPALRVVVLGHGLWTTRLGADPSVVGRTVRLDDEVYEVVGVAPAHLDVPEGVDLWVRAPREVPPIPGYPGDITAERTAWYFDVVGRLADGTSLEAAQAELDAVAAALRGEHPDANEGAGIAARPLHEELVGDVRGLLTLLLGAVGLVLLAACANVASLVLVRAEGRRRELAVRSALGAGSRRLLRFVLAEGLVLALTGGALGAALAAAALPGLLAMLPEALPRQGEIVLDGAVLLFTLGASLGTCLLFTTAPALLAGRTDPARALAGRSGGDGGRGGRWLRGGLVTTEVALGVVLAAGTGLVVRSVGEMASVDPGFRAEGLATFRVSVPDARAIGEEARVALWERLAGAVEAHPSVGEAAVGMTSPTATGPEAGLRVVGAEPFPPDFDASVVWHPATPGLLETLGVPLVRGRLLDERDRAGGAPVAVVNEALARRFFPGGDAVGRSVTIGLDEGHGVEIGIVGVVGDTRSRGPVRDAPPILYRPLAQAGDFGGGAMSVVARGAAASAVTLRAAVEAVRAAEPGAVVYGEAVGEDLGGAFLADHRFMLRLLGLFAALAVGLAAVGVYGVTAHAVRRRRRELGIRMAVGAGRARVVGEVVRGGLAFTAAGVGVGLAAAAAGGEVLSAWLFQVRPADPLTLGTVALVLLGVSALALVLPAREAVRVDPAEAMRPE